MFIIGSAYPMLPNNDRSFKSRTSRRLWLYCMKLINIVLMTAPFAACWYIFYAGGIKNPFFNKGNWVVVGLFALLYIVFCKLYSGLSISTKRITEAVYSQTLSAFISNAFVHSHITAVKRVRVFSRIAAGTGDTVYVFRYLDIYRTPDIFQKA